MDGDKRKKKHDWRDRKDVPDIVWKLEARRERYAHRSLLFRVAWTLLAVLITIAGLIMIVTPGPALVLIPAGLAMLSFEFTWAENLLDLALTRGMDAKQYTEHLDKRKKRAVIVSGICLAAAVIGAIVYWWVLGYPTNW